MTNFQFSFLLTMFILLAACTPGGTEPALEPEPAASNTPVETDVPEATETPPEPYPYPGVTEPVLPTDPYPVDDGAPPADVITDGVSPVEVDLSQLTPQPPEDTGPTVLPQPGSPDPGTAVAHQVSQDLAKRLGVDVSDIQMLSVEEVDWPNSALGCPAPGLDYLMVITPGYKITLEAAREQYTYHTDMRGNAILCGDDGRPVLPE